ncbi:phosphatidylglycerophosphatase A [Aliisedimentitalea scapharcae]|uniref:Phosphatidylglycerophosphatase A n=1 Tax=Aliisedimentitalea scapharcae TaxID=1524259 RepID=A0ABZ2XP22_9RHOB|nr:phosphatidylglycerophosphatase A [Rhodobacteraceae bacterium M382]
MKQLAHMIGTVCGVGHIRPAPGTWGSAVALPLAWALHTLGGFPLLLMGTAFALIVGIWATREYTSHGGDHDPSEIVIDEVAGQFTALLPLSYAAWAHDIPVLAMWPGWIAAFVLFRLFDITKPGPIGTADRRGDALGVMLDDIIAGVFAAIGVMALAGVWHGVMGQ